MIAKHGSGAEIFHLVVLRRTRSVSVDVVDLIEGHACIGESVAYAVGDRNPVRFGTGTMESVCQFAAAGDHAKIFAPRDCAASRLSSTSAPAPSAITNPCRFFEKGFDARRGSSL